MIGDIPCKLECGNRSCRYNHFGLCDDNDVCGDRKDADGNPWNYGEEDEADGGGR